MTESHDNRRINSVAVYAGSKNGNDPAYAQAAAEMGALLGGGGYDLIYGGGDFGLMGVVARAAAAAGSKVKGLIVRVWAAATGMGAIPGVEDVVVEDRNERKGIMTRDSQASIMLPGGIGSWDEVFDILAHQDEQRYAAPDAPPRPIIILNTNGVYDHIKGLIADGAAAGFIYEQSRNLVRFADTPQDVMDILDEYNNPRPAPSAGPQFSP